MTQRLTGLTKLTRMIIIVPLAIVGMAVFIAIGGEVVKLLWNWLAPELFGLRPISFWQAVGLLALCRILFGGFSAGGSAHRNSGRRLDRRIRQRIRERMDGRWERMTPEERERFKQGLRSECYGDTNPADSPPSS